jgi:hypothetical protein
MPGPIPASRVEVFDVIAPANTPKSAPIELPTIWAPGELVSVDVRIPDGASGLVGFQILYAHGQAIPNTPGAWIIGNDDLFTADVMGQLNGGQWGVNVYNTDRFPHSLHVRYHVADLSYIGAGLLPAPTTLPELS